MWGVCDLEGVVDVQHWLLHGVRDGRVNGWTFFRHCLGYHWVLIWLLRMIKLVAILNQGCKHHSILKIILKMWIARFS